MTAINRRHLILGSSSVAMTGGFGMAWWHAPKSGTTLLSAADDQNGRHCLVGQTTNGRNLFCIPVPQRAHQAIAHPLEPLAVFLGRRPSNQIYLVDTQKGILQHTITAPNGHHFYGHGVINGAGDTLYVSENDYHEKRGLIGVYEMTAPYRRLGQFASGGIGPHQLEILHQSATLVVANGGIETHPKSGRRSLNLECMAPNLSYINLKTHEITQRVEPEHHQLSVRHLAVAPNDQVIVGLQDQQDAPLEIYPLVLRHTLGTPNFDALTTDMAVWQKMNQYIASVAVSSDSRWAVSTTPRGNLVSLWDLKAGRAQEHIQVRDVAGALWLDHPQHFVVSNGLGQWLSITPGEPAHVTLVERDHQLRWDNHLGAASGGVS